MALFHHDDDVSPVKLRSGDGPVAVEASGAGVERFFQQFGRGSAAVAALVADEEEVHGSGGVLPVFKDCQKAALSIGEPLFQGSEVV